MCLHYGVKHDLIGHFVGACLDHCDQLAGGSNGNIHFALCALLQSRVYNYLAVYQSELNAAYRTVPRDVRNCYCSRNTDHSGDFGTAIRIDRHDCRHYRAIVTHIFREKRTNRAVDAA